MCGITGFIDNNIKEKDDILNKMMDRIKHRGPDGRGKYIDNDIALGHVRLSIIDIESGKQPMISNDNNYILIFNGEIYNYIELKSELQKKGYKFNTKSDTEVILIGYQEYKEDIVKKLRGMFSFVIWDKKEKVLFGARDHFGIKPFYYYKNNNTFMFASEIKSFLDNPSFEKELNTDILLPYLSFNYPPTSETFFKNVYRLEPGHYFILKNNKFNVTRYFELDFNVENNDLEDNINKIDKVMYDSINKHLLSDVEVGSFLSSGIDSSYIVSVAKPDKTYTIGYENPKYNEANYAKDLTNKLGLTNKEKIITKNEYMDIIPKVMYHMDEPLADPAAIALYFVSNLASKEVKVVLSGEGADELFGGYNTYQDLLRHTRYNKMPYFIRHLIAVISKKLPEFKGRNFYIRRGYKLEDDYIGVTKIFNEFERLKITNKNLLNKSNKSITKSCFDKHKNDSKLIKMQSIDINFWLIKDIFQKADKMTMANSIEGRVPFTDIEVFKVASSLPDNQKISLKNTKIALRLAAKRHIPNEAYNKKKLGFPVPVREWIKEEDFYNQIKEEFNSDISKKLFNNKRILKLLDKHKNNKKDNYKKIWTIYTFLVWYKQFF